MWYEELAILLICNAITFFVAFKTGKNWYKFDLIKSKE